MGSRAALSCLLLCILHLLAGAAAWPSYMVMFPYVIYYSHGGKVHIQFMDLDAPVRVTLSLISSHSIPDVILEQMGNSSLQLDWPLFPSNSTPTEEVATVHVVIRGGSLWVSKYREVLLKAPDLWTMIQTDRAAYMRGQTVKFRILCLDEDFMPSDSKTTCPCAQDPSGKSISRWQDVRPRQGITDLSLPLGRDAALGTYTIATEGKNHTFEVQRSWKPRFKVLLQLPSFVMETDEKIPLHVCGRYSSGKPFQGEVEVSLCQFHKYLSSSNESARCVVLEGQAERNGCFSTQVSMAAFNLTSSDYARWFFANASLVDEDTGKMKSVTKSCRIFPEMPEDAFRNINGFHNSEMPYAGMVMGALHASQPYFPTLAPRLQDDINFLKIHRMKTTPPCSQPLQIHVDYNFNEKFLGTNLQSVDVFFLVS
ncbi:A2ML1 protein, partial [Penelope pileata]|nr:A2ML1 protein [Penelope pileata]